jgi:hypothetical protein
MNTLIPSPYLCEDPYDPRKEFPQACKRSWPSYVGMQA